MDANSRHKTKTPTEVSEKLEFVGLNHLVGTATSRKPTVLYADDALRPSPLKEALQLDALAYQEPPRMTFTLWPFSAPF